MLDTVNLTCLWLRKSMAKEVIRYVVLSTDDVSLNSKVPSKY